MTRKKSSDAESDDGAEAPDAGETAGPANVERFRGRAAADPKAEGEAVHTERHFERSSSSPAEGNVTYTGRQV